MPQTGQKTITVSGKHLLELQKKYDLEREKHPGISFASFIAESALMELERRQLVREAAFISLIGMHDDMITLKDSKTKRFVEVQIKNQKLKCLTDDSTNCIHVGFTFALPEVRKALGKQ